VQKYQRFWIRYFGGDRGRRFRFDAKPVSPRSKVLLYDIGLLMSMMLQSQCKNVISGMFGDTWKRVPMPKNGILRNVDAFYKREGEVGYSPTVIWLSKIC
jgi:hypothetical protein